KMTDGLFLQCARDVHQSDPKYSKLELNDLIVDNCCMQLLANPYNFDVILTSNLYGNIISNILTSLIGGPGIIPGWLYGPGITIYESGSRKSDSCSAGKNIVNPIGEILALSYLADDIAIKTDSKRRGESIRKALNDLLDNNPESYTFDMGGSATTSEFMAKLMSKVEKYI
ncbi:MAG: Isocitrate dehydrogenase [NAD] subunit gamma 1, mitochondrial, partial [Paramarteilia canceri]